MQGLFCGGHSRLPELKCGVYCMHAQQNAVAAGAGIGLLPLFSAKANSRLVPVLADDVRVYRDVYLSVHEDLEFMTRIRSVSRHLVQIFERDRNYLNEF